MTCTCGWRDPDSGWSTYKFDPACPEHGLDALIAQATPDLDIDEEEEA